MDANILSHLKSIKGRNLTISQMALKYFTLFFIMMIILTFISHIADSLTIPIVNTGVARSGKLNFNVDGTGVIEADNEEYIDIEEELRVIKIFVQSGAKIKKGDPIFCFDINEVKDKYENKKTELAKLEISLNKTILEYSKQSEESSVYDEQLANLRAEINLKEEKKKLEKENEEDEWYSFAKTEYNGTDDIVINLQENTGLSVLKATFRISSKAQAGSEPIVKVIALKQGNKVEAERHSFVDNEWTITAGKPVFADGAVNFAYEGTNCRISREGMKPGSYKFHISASSNDAQCQLYFLYGEKEIRWMLFKGEGENARCGTSDGGVIQYPFNNKKSEYTVEMNILEGAPSGSMKLEWHLDGALLRSIPSYTGVAYGTNAQIILGVAKGTATYDWWEYTAPIEWGDE